jgi:hypothetical protein
MIWPKFLLLKFFLNLLAQKTKTTVADYSLPATLTSFLEPNPNPNPLFFPDDILSGK